MERPGPRGYTTLVTRWLLLPTLLAAGCSLDAAELGSLGRGIVNGSPAPFDLAPAAGALVVDTPGDYRVFCSGTLIGDRLVLTAAHCFGSLPVDTPIAFFAGTSIKPGDYSPSLASATSIHKAPAYVGGAAPSWIGRYEDIALVKLAANPAVKPVPLIRPAEVAALVKTGRGVLLLGFGQTVAGDKTTVGTKQQGASYVGEVGSHELHVLGAGAPQKCHGDSGGPTLADLDDGPGFDLRLVGVTSRADTDCTEGSIETRVDMYLSWIHGVGGAAIPCGSGQNPDCPPPAELGPPDLTLDVPAADGVGGDSVTDPGDSGCAITASRPGPTAPFLSLFLLILGLFRRRR